MTIASQKITLEDYLAYNDGIDTRYELTSYSPPHFQI